MTLADMLAAHDPITLEAMTSKGLVRRAAKQMQADGATVDQADAVSAVVVTEGQTVSIDSSGPGKAQCSCPAPAICRHILTAVLLLRDHDALDSGSEKELADIATESGLETVALKADKDEDAEPRQTKLETALESLSQLSIEQLRKFAGADWAEASQLAVKLVAEIEKPEIISQGVNSVVKLDNGLYSVTFIAGQDLKEAVFKGPKTKKRLVTATCALILRHSIDIAIEVEATGENAKGLTSAYLSDAQLTLEMAATTVLGGAADIAADKLFDLAISARVQVAPRLSSQLRSLSKMALKAKEHSIDFHANDFLVLLSRSYALVRALQVTPDDPKLTGSLRRDYTATEPLTLWFLGAKHWATPSGARGITAYAYSEEHKVWYSSSIARVAGMQLTFDPYLAYEEALWGANSMYSLVGRCVKLMQPRVSSDQQIAADISAEVTPNQPLLTQDFLQSSSSLIEEWDVLLARVRQGLGEGLTRGVLPIAQLLKPKRFGALSFEEFTQTYYWEIVDSRGQIINLELSTDYSHQIEQLRLMESRISAILVEAVLVNDKLHFFPVSLLAQNQKRLQVMNLQFHRLGDHSSINRMLKRFKDKVLPTKKPEAITQDALAELANDCIALIADWIAYPHGQPDALAAIIRRCEISGLNSLANAMRPLASTRQTSQMLAAVYIASEVFTVSGLN